MQSTMQSLRTRRPSQARTRAGNRAPPMPKDGLARKSTRVDDKIKKRMSMRYAEISSPTGADGAPPVPALPLSLQPGGMRGHDISMPITEEPKEDPREAELRLLDDDNFDADAYLKLKMANSTEAELRSLQSSLQSSKDGVALDLQRNVFKNYAEFVMVSKEVSTLESEMLELKEALAEWKSMPSLLHIDDSASVAERRRNVRSSIADLRVLYANQMQTLHSTIEGSAKFVPTTPGRHVVVEMDNILALNPATYKVDHAVRFVLLDDAVLVARRRKRRNNTESDKLIAERCWPLNEILVLDTKDTPSMTNVFKIRYNKETLVYRTEIAADKKQLLVQFRHVAEELAAKKRKEREGEHQRRKSLWVGGDRSSQAIPDVPPLPDFLAEMMGKSDVGASAKEKTERDARWIGDFTDDLTVAIALRKWDHAVALVEEGEKKMGSMPILGAKLTPLKSSLTSALLQSLSTPSNRKSTVVRLISLLVRLNAGAAARSTFLSSRTEVMRKRVRMITFEGHIGMYISDLAIVVFTGIKHTADWFLASFKENEVASCFVEWAKEQVEAYAEMYRKQVFSSDVSPQTVDEARKITHAHSKKLLEEYGLDFRFLLERLLADNTQNGSPKNTPPTYRPHSSRRPSDPIHTPASTPVRSRSPAPIIANPIPSRARSPAGSVASSVPFSVSSSPVVPSIPSPALSTTSAATSVTSPTPRVRVGSGASLNAPPRPESQHGELISKIPGPRPPPRSGPAPPPRSRDRPSTPSGGHRPPPVAIPRREGMF